MPGEAEVSRSVPLPTSGRLALITAPAVDVVPGQTVKVEFGGLGRPVAGMVSLPPESATRIDFATASGYLAIDQPSMPLPKGYQNWDVEKKGAYRRQWYLSAEGKARHNTGKYVGKSNRLEDTIVKTNTEAVKEIVRQIRLRDLGGIIVVDFIDMDERKNRQKVMQALEEAMRADNAPYKILQFNDFGLVAITRKRVKQSLERTLCSPCPYCEGAGYVKSVQTVVTEILAEAQKIAKPSPISRETWCCASIRKWRRC